MRRPIVVFPEPTLPTMPTRSPLAILQLSSFNAAAPVRDSKR